MARQFEARWHAASESWRSDCGDLYIDSKGRQRRKTVTFRYADGRKIPKADKAAAFAALARRMEELKPREAGALTVSQLAEYWLFWLEKQVQADFAAARTYDGHREMLALLEEEFGKDTLAESITARDLKSVVDDWLAGRRIHRRDRDKPNPRLHRYSPNYCNRLITTASACWSWAASPIANRLPGVEDSRKLPETLLPSNPFAKFPKIKVPRTPPKYADRAEVARFLRWAWNAIHPERNAPGKPPRKNRPRDYWHRQTILIVRLCLWTGCRPNEAARALWEWIDWQAGTITMPPKRHKTGRKTGQARVIYLTPTLLRALKRVHDGPVRHPAHVFAHRHGRDGVKGGDSTTGKPWKENALTKRIQGWRDRAIADGVPLKREGENRWHLYRLRHTRASDGLMLGHSEATVAEVLGTSADMIRQTYGHLLDEHTAKAARAMTGKRSAG